jgi:hypothetical protein
MWGEATNAYMDIIFLAPNHVPFPKIANFYFKERFGGIHPVFNFNF